MELAGVPGRRAPRASSRTFEAFEAILAELYAEYTFEFAAAESGVAAATLREVAEAVAGAGTRLSHPHLAQRRRPATWAAGRWRAPCSCSTPSSARSPRPGGTFPNAWNKFVPRPIHWPAAPARAGTS